ncbi:RNA polymerase factor sigma-54 [Halalkalibacter akibai]|uniref:RNA polymerase sigma-54 factor RpoN n=1 Tax=Halalkalibacter akibai (strain ATCC 43226 / DSM 21942 / CIP 109018 / JCM 9157 / 1139) TaxID=1236973 RepID=W4QN85_HALA3|nr:RNA polymerase factor sigma-54 [Halalkalibacter akibai]GAE33118.1 RNA polymerase sigma-54 factor RpoN [Halalkalibacter akibai JCM 9157]
MQFGLYQQQTTSLVMTQELRQAIHLLQYSAVELVNYLNEQSLDNPLLDVKESKKNEDYSFLTSNRRTQQESQPSIIDYAHINRKTLNDHLLAQVQELKLSKKQKKEMNYLIYSLREDGYLARPLSEVCEELQLDLEEGEELLFTLQSFEPAGVGARDLQECLLLQLERLENRNFLAEQIITHYMEPFAKRKWKNISLVLKVTLAEIQEVKDLIQTLDPRPGTQFISEPVQFVKPELRIVPYEGDLLVHIEDDLIPNVGLNHHYEQLLQQEGDSESTQYAKQKVQQVQWLVKTIQQRKQTILKVAEAIARHQKEYFLNKTGVLKPLTLREIADEIEVHESTVSRATSNKYADTPRGVIELKSLFTSSLQNESGDTTSSQSIKNWMKELIATENKQKPLSDAKIATWLQTEKQTNVSRRAIAKYRDELGIPASSKRKRYES